jgi:hypothetical protein
MELTVVSMSDMLQLVVNLLKKTPLPDNEKLKHIGHTNSVAIKKPEHHRNSQVR